MFSLFFLSFFIWLPRVLVASCRIYHSDAQILELLHVGSVVACRLSCSTACGISVPQPGIELKSPALQGGFLTTGPPGEFLLIFYIKGKLFPLGTAVPQSWSKRQEDSTMFWSVIMSSVRQGFHLFPGHPVDREPHRVRTKLPALSRDSQAK